MFELADILGLFAGEFSVDKKQDMLDRFSAHAICRQAIAGARIAVPQFIADKGILDRLLITITAGDPFSFDSSRADNNSFFEKWEKFQGDADHEDEVQVDVVVEKKLQGGDSIFIYSSQVFLAYLEGLSPVQLISAFSRQFQQGPSTLFLVSPEFQKGGRSASICFIPTMAQKNQGLTWTTDHVKAWEKLNGISHFSGISGCVALPEDFAITDAGCLPANVHERFKQACMLLVLGILYDFMAVQGDTASLKLNGYKTFSVDIPAKNPKLDSLDTYYKIYSWVNAGGNIQDKIGLARNLISLNLDPGDKYTVSESVYTSILSGFKVYEKQNVKQYIELRNKMSDQIIGFNEKAGKVIDAFAGSFQKSALAVVTLYASFVVTRVLTSHDYTNVFTKEALILSFVFLAACLGYFFVSRWEVDQQRTRFVESYNDMKERNEDLLTKEDIQKILNNDKEHTKDVAFIDAKRKRYTWLWIGFIVLFGIGAIVLYNLDVSGKTVGSVVKTPAVPAKIRPDTLRSKSDSSYRSPIGTGSRQAPVQGSK